MPTPAAPIRDDEAAEVVLAGRRLVVSRGTPLLDLCDAMPDMPFRFGCREGGCGTCIVRVGEASQLNAADEVEAILLEAFVDGDPRARLGCQVRILGPAVIDPWPADS